MRILISLLFILSVIGEESNICHCNSIEFNNFCEKFGLNEKFHRAESTEILIGNTSFYEGMKLKWCKL